MYWNILCLIFTTEMKGSSELKFKNKAITVRFTKLLTNSFRSLFEIPEVRYKFGNFTT